MKNVITRYLFGQLSLATLGITLVLTAAIWLTQSLRFLDFVINGGISLGKFFKLTMLLLPDLISIILPIGTLSGILFVYNRLYMDSEWVVFKSLGLSHLKIAKPALLVAGIVIIFLYTVNLYFLPLSFQKFKDLEYNIRNKTADSVIQAGEFKAFKGITFYVRQRQPNGNLRGILIHDAREKRKTINISAEKGIVVKNNQAIRFILLNGHRQEYDSATGQPTTLSFKQYALELALASIGLKERGRKKPHERYLFELFDPPEAKKKPLYALKLKAEAHQRLLMPFTVLGFALISLSIFQCGEYNRRGRVKRITVAIVACTLFEAAMLSLIHLSEKISYLISLAYILCTLVCLVGVLFLTEKVSSRSFNFRKKVS